ncbi:hypothetical protein LBMAG15_20320 [Actinomycetes bacterium]|nr:hypothetical protein LBMAG15_20320 [Actinomycetes bacterium]
MAGAGPTVFAIGAPETGVAAGVAGLLARVTSVAITPVARLPTVQSIERRFAGVGGAVAHA